MTGLKHAVVVQNLHSLHNPTHWMLFYSSIAERSTAWNIGNIEFDDTNERTNERTKEVITLP